jgi:hypothetical protein
LSSQLEADKSNTQYRSIWINLNARGTKNRYTDLTLIVTVFGTQVGVSRNGDDLQLQKLRLRRR